MSSFPLSGTVTKAVLLVSPAYAQEKELLHFLKYKLYDAGFILVHEEYRRINHELANEVCVQFDYTPEYLLTNPHREQQQQQEEGVDGDAAAAAVTGSASASAGVAEMPASQLPTACAMVGNAYVYVLAHRDCHNALQSFVLHTLLLGSNAVQQEADAAGDADGEEEVSFMSLVASIAANKPNVASDDDETNGMDGQFGVPPAIFVNRTAAGAKKTVSQLFPRMLAEDVPTAVQSREYVQANLKIALLPALTELSKQKPTDPLRWLAERLLHTNPHSPPMVKEGE